MSVKERILSLKLLEKQEKQKQYMNRIGITITLIEKSKTENDCNKLKGVRQNDNKNK